MELLKVENLTFTYPRQNPDAAEPEPALQTCILSGAGRGVCGGLRRIRLWKDHAAETAEAGAGPGRRKFRKHLVSRRGTGQR